MPEEHGHSYYVIGRLMIDGDPDRWQVTRRCDCGDSYSAEEPFANWAASAQKEVLFRRVCDRLVRQMIRAAKGNPALLGDLGSIAVFSTRIVLEMLRAMSAEELAVLLAEDDPGQPSVT